MNRRVDPGETRDGPWMDSELAFDGPRLAATLPKTVHARDSCCIAYPAACAQECCVRGKRGHSPAPWQMDASAHSHRVRRHAQPWLCLGGASSKGSLQDDHHPGRSWPAPSSVNRKVSRKWALPTRSSTSTCCSDMKSDKDADARGPSPTYEMPARA